jgi:hypothetical protein
MVFLLHSQVDLSELSNLMTSWFWQVFDFKKKVLALDKVGLVLPFFQSISDLFTFPRVY